MRSSYSPYTLATMIATVFAAWLYVPDMWQAQDMNGLLGVFFYTSLVAAFLFIHPTGVQGKSLVLLFAVTAFVGLSLQKATSELRLLAIISAVSALFLAVDIVVGVVIQFWKQRRQAS